jgi:hypothetical protein
VEITNELQLSEHGNTPDRTFEEEVIDDGIQTISEDSDPFQDETFKEIPISDQEDDPKIVEDPDDDIEVSEQYSQEEFESESPNKFTNSRVQNNLNFADTLEVIEEKKDQVEENMLSPERTSGAKQR